MSKKEPTTDLVRDYVLDLLTPVEKEQLNQQILTDPALLPRIQKERQVGSLVKQTLEQAVKAEHGRLAHRLPLVPLPKRNKRGPLALRQMALAALVFVLLLGGWQWFKTSQPAIWPARPTLVAVTATVTQAPTATETRSLPTETAVTDHLQPEIAKTPEVRITNAVATPMAAVPVNAN